MSLSIGKIIKTLRKERNLTQEELAEQLNVTYQAISKWENETGMPDISQIVPLASVFGVSTDVLFGTFGTNDDEGAQKILENAYKLKGIAVYDALQEGLRHYPNNVELLMNCLERGIGHAYPENGPQYYDEARGQEIYQECIRMANLIINYSKNVNVGDVFRAYMIMVILHSAYGNIEKAQEHANQFPCRSDMTYNHMLAFIAHYEKNYTDEVKYSRDNTKYHLESLADAMMQLANGYKHMQRKDCALEVYNRVNQLLALFPNDEHFSTPNVWTEWGQLDELIGKL